MIGAVAGEDLVAAGIHPGDLYRVLVGVRTGIGEEHLAHVVRHQADDQLGQFRPILVGVGLADEGVTLQLGLDGVVDILIAVAQVHVDMKGGHIGIAVAVVVIEVDIVAVLNGNGIQPLLLVPGLEHIGLLCFSDLFGSHTKPSFPFNGSWVRVCRDGSPPWDIPADRDGSLRSSDRAVSAPGPHQTGLPDGRRRNS